MGHIPSREEFLQMTASEVARLVSVLQRPRVGVFVPDGSRRLVLAYTEAEPETEQFYRFCATLPAQYLLQALKIMFGHGLPVLLVPILSRSVLARGSDYRRLTALLGLEMLFASDEWQQFYDEYDVRVRVYGDPKCLMETECAPALDWIDQTEQRTAIHRAHTLFYAIGESARAGQEITRLAISFYMEHNHIPTLEEQINQYYGESIDTVDFFIMSSKMSGLGALPRFLVSSDTETYFLAAPGGIGLTEHTFRAILHDLLFVRPALRSGIQSGATRSERLALRQAYETQSATVAGLGRLVSQVWIPET